MALANQESVTFQIGQQAGGFSLIQTAPEGELIDIIGCHPDVKPAGLPTELVG